MKTSKFLTALALPLAFVACSDDYLENNGPVANEFGNRPMVGQVEFNDVASSLTRYAVDGSMNLSWATGDQFGMILMDEQAEVKGGADISSRHYNLVNKAYTNYPFTRNESGAWVSEAQLVEGNYFYYFPYVQAQAGDRNVARGTGLTWNIPTTQKYEAEDNANKSVQANQLYVGYQALSADAATTELQNKMAPVFPTLTFKITNTDASPVVINRVVLEKADGTGYGSEADAFNTKFTLDVVNGASKAIDYKPILNPANGKYEKNIDVTASSAINQAFGSFNQALAEDFNNYEKAPFANMQTSYLTAVANAKASTFVLELPDVELAKNGAYEATLVVPSDIDADDLQARIYTNKGIVLLPLEVGAYTVSVIASEDASNGLVKYDTKVLKDDEVADASVTLAVLKADKKWDIYGEAENDARTNFTSLVPNQNATVSIKFNSKAIAVPGKMDIYSTEDLDAFLSYAKAANVTKVTPMEATLKADGVKLSKAAYDILGNDKIQLTVKADKTRSLTIAADAGANALYKFVWGDKVNKAIIEKGGSQVLKANFSKDILNEGTLTVDQNWSGSSKVNTVSGNIVNLGTMTVNGTLEAIVTNGAKLAFSLDGVNYDIDYDDVVTTAEIKVNNSITKKLINAAKASVADGVTISGLVYNNSSSTVVNKNTVYRTAELTTGNATFNKLVNLGILTVDTKKTLVVGGTSSSNGTIHNNGMFKPSGEFTNSGIMYNNYGIVCQTTGTFANEGTLNVTDGAVYTYISDNTGEVVISERDANLTIADAQGDISYTADADDENDFDGAEFLVYDEDKFNKLTVNRNGADLSAIYKDEYAPYAGTTVAKVILNVGADSELKFADGQSLTALTIGTGNNLVDVKAKGLVVTTDLTIKDNTTLHIPNGYDMTFKGESISNKGILLVGGTFTATVMSQPSETARYEEAGGNINWKN